MSTTSITTTPQQPTKPLHPVDGWRAWTQVLAAFLVHFCVLGNLYGFSIFILPLAGEFKLSRGEVSLVGTISLALFYAFGIIAGPLADRYGVRKILTIGTILWTTGMLTAAASTGFVTTVISQGVLTGMGTALCYWPAISGIPQWFDKNRGTGTSMAVLGAGIGNLVFALGGSSIINSSLGWRGALLVLGGMGGGLLCIAIIILERRLPNVRHGGIFDTGKELLHDRNYRIFLVSTFFFQMGFFPPFEQLAPYIHDLGMSDSTASLAVALLGVGSSVGRVVFGPIADQFGRIRIFRYSMVAAAIVMALWPACTTEGSVFAFAFFYPAMAGGFIAMVPLVAGDLWGVHRLGGIFSFVNLAMIPGGLASGSLAGLAYDSTGSYNAAIFSAAGCLGIAAALLFLIKVPAPRQESVRATSFATTDHGVIAAIAVSTIEPVDTKSLLAATMNPSFEHIEAEGYGAV